MCSGSSEGCIVSHEKETSIHHTHQEAYSTQRQNTMLRTFCLEDLHDLEVLGLHLEVRLTGPVAPAAVVVVVITLVCVGVVNKESCVL